MSNLLNRLEQRKMPSKDVPICLDLNLLEARDKAMANLAIMHRQQKNDQRMAGDTADVNAARAAVDAAESAIRDASIVIRITGVDRTRYNQFLLQCPPRKGRQEPFDSTKFYMHVARQTGQYVDEHGAVHDMTDEEWAKIDSTITDGEHDRIAQAVVDVNRTVGGQGIDFLGRASGTTTDSSETSV